MRSALVVLTLGLVTACGTQGGGAEPPASSTPATSTTATTTASLKDLGDEWSGKFDDITRAFTGAPCAPTKVQTKDCAQYLTAIVRTSNDLEATIRKRSDSSAYVDTLIETRKISQASEAYAKPRCYEGGGDFEVCQAQMIAITMGSVLVATKLKLDELKKK